MPLDSRLQVAFQLTGRPQPPEFVGITGWVKVTAGYFETFQIPILRGRTFMERDESGPRVAIVNETLAKQFWPNSDPLNGQITIGDDSPVHIIGVAGDVHDQGLNHAPRPTLYVA